MEPYSTSAATIDADENTHAELRRQILRIQDATHLSEREKAREMQHVMTMNYLSLSRQNHTKSLACFDEPLSITDLAKTYYDEESGVLGCAHYQRACKLQCSTCSTWATCRFCHNEDRTDHELIRTDTKFMLCMHCVMVQPAAQYCAGCARRMASYYCGKCKLWDDDPNKQIYHCQDCGICRVGHGLGKDFFRTKICSQC